MEEVSRTIRARSTRPGRALAAARQMPCLAKNAIAPQFGQILPLLTRPPLGKPLGNGGVCAEAMGWELGRVTFIAGDAFLCSGDGVRPSKTGIDQ